MPQKCIFIYIYEVTQEEGTEENQENMPSASTSSHTKKKGKHKKNKTEPAFL